MKDNGVWIKWKVGVHFIMLIKLLHMKVNGKMINFMDMEYCIIKYQIIFINSMILKIYILLIIIGLNIKEILLMILKMVKGRYF